MKERDKDVLNQLNQQWGEEQGKQFELFKNVDHNYKEERKKQQYINIPNFRYKNNAKRS